jgi:CubicO group peptidase (beta-lactamase class C family)
MRSLLCAPLALLLALLLGNAAHADATPPDTVAGRTLADWLEVVNSGDRAKIVAYDKKYGQPEKDPDRIEGLHQATGGFSLVRIEKSEPLTVTVLLKEKGSDAMLRFELSVTDGTPTKIAGANLQQIETPADLAVPRMTQGEALEALGALIDKNAEADAFSGVVLVARREDVLYQRSAGLADREKKIEVTPDTRFRLDSMNKMFTTVSILQLMEAGKLELDDPIGKYLTDYPNKELASKVTVRHLLTHSGGTGDFFGPEFAEKRLTLREHSDYLKLFGARALAFEPGSKRAYSNYGFILLGAIVEKLSGMSYYDYVDKKVYAPVGMKRTGSLPESTAVEGRAVGYMKPDATWVRNDDTLPWRGMAAGGGYSTAPDLLRFAQALEAGKLVSKESLRLATTDKGLGFFVSGEGKLRTYGHGGGAPGMNGDLKVYPELGVVVVALSNLDPPAAERLSDYYVRRMPVD